MAVDMYGNEQPKEFDASKFYPKLGDVFTDDVYYSHYAEWANEHQYIINEIDALEDGTRQFTVVEPEKPSAEEIELQKVQQEEVALNASLKSIEQQYVQAQLLENTDVQTKLKTQYTSLLGGE